ncbi:hypothetical protein FGB62_6g415 [Gracilaria domingensis]|nr:hypothetical protein FGB62_6g415 [Gracilaria domingensis]
MTGENSQRGRLKRHDARSEGVVLQHGVEIVARGLRRRINRRASTSHADGLGAHAVHVAPQSKRKAAAAVRAPPLQARRRRRGDGQARAKGGKQAPRGNTAVTG